jgi:peptidyl-dipeptidase A
MRTLLLTALILAAPKPTKDDAKRFVDGVNVDLKEQTVRMNTAGWVHSTFITDDTERMDAFANDDYLAYVGKATHESDRFRSLKLDPTTARMLYLLRMTPQLPAPKDAAQRKELSELSSKLSSLYGTGKWCGKDGKGPCKDLLALEDVINHSRDYQALVDAWAGWHSVGRPMRPLYQRLMELSNQGAKDIGYKDLGEFWRGGYDMTPAAFAKETDRLWEQVRPFYEQLHCYVRSKLSGYYGKDRVHSAIHLFPERVGQK